MSPERITYLDGSYGTRRQRAILNYLDRAEKEFSTFGLNSVIEAFVQSELLSIDNYNYMDSNCDFRIGAALWILDKLRATGKLVEAYKILPDISKVYDAWYLPMDFAHPCYDVGLIQSVIHAISIRYSQQSQHDIVMTEENARGQKPCDTYERLMELLPTEEVEKACKEFKIKLWDITSRFMKAQGYYDREIECSEQEFTSSFVRSTSLLAVQPNTLPTALPNSPIEAALSVLRLVGDDPLNTHTLPNTSNTPSETERRYIDNLQRGRELKKQSQLLYAEFDDYLQMEKRLCENRRGGRYRRL